MLNEHFSQFNIYKSESDTRESSNSRVCVNSAGVSPFRASTIPAFFKAIDYNIFQLM